MIAIRMLICDNPKDRNLSVAGCLAHGKYERN
jgi:hypothetical protein